MTSHEISPGYVTTGTILYERFRERYSIFKPTEPEKICRYLPIFRGAHEEGPQFRVQYSDGDSEDLSRIEIRELLHMG